MTTDVTSETEGDRTVEISAEPSLWLTQEGLFVDRWARRSRRIEAFVWLTIVAALTVFVMVTSLSLAT